MVFSLVFLAAAEARGDAPPESTGQRRVLHVGTTQSEPWMMFDDTVPEAKRVPTGFSADLWTEIAKRLHADTQWVYYASMPELLDAVKDHKVDAGIAAVSISLEREKYLDFSNSMHESGLRILTRNQHAETGSTVARVMKSIFWNLNTLLVLGVLILVAHMLWLFNRRREGDFVPHPYGEGIKESMRWAFSGLMGSGGGTPKKGVPWVIGLTWSFVSKMLFVVLTGVFSAALALSAIENQINNIGDLKGKRTAVVAGNAPEAFMGGLSTTTLVPVPAFQDGVDMLVKGKVDAFVHDAPRLQYWRNKVNLRDGKDTLRVTMEDFARQNYGIIFPVGSTLRKDVNLQLLNLREATPGTNSFYDELVTKWIPH